MAKAVWAEKLATDECLSITDNVREDRDATAKARLQIETRHKIAGALNAKFSQRPHVTTNHLTIGELHLIAMKEVNAAAGGITSGPHALRSGEIVQQVDVDLETGKVKGLF